MVLYRPVGMKELKLIYETDMTSFPPRLPSQPIFYPVLTLLYAEQIARDWNAKNEPYAGYVTRFEIDDVYRASFERKVVGSKIHAEIWVPSDELPNFNRNIRPPIVVVSAYFGSAFKGYSPAQDGWAGKDADEQLRCLSRALDGSLEAFGLEIAANHRAVFLNYLYWECCDLSPIEMTDERRGEVLEAVQVAWGNQGRTAQLTRAGQCVG